MTAAWEVRSLADVCTIRPPKSEARERLADQDEVSFVPMEDLGIDQKVLQPSKSRPLADVAGSYTYFADGDVLLAKITPCFENGKLGIAAGLKNGVGFGSSEFMVFRPCDSLSKEWLYYYLSRESFRQEGAERMTGAVGHKRVSKEFIEEYPIPVPPLGEQKRIVAILDEAFEGIATAKANAEKNLRNSRSLIASYLELVFVERRDNWVEVPLDSITEAGSAITYGVVKPGEEGEVKFVRGGDLVRGRVRIEKLRTITRAVSEQYRRTLLRGGELLICLVGQPGQVAVAPDELAGANIARQVGLIRLRKDVNAEFVRFFLQSPPGLSALGARESGSVQQVINLGELRHLLVPLPDLALQNEIVKELEVAECDAERLESNYRQKITALDDLKKSLLHHAFSGQL